MLKILDEKKRDLAIKREQFIEAQDGETFFRIEDRGRALLKFMRAYGSDLEKVPFSTFIEGSEKLAQGIQNQSAEILLAKRSLSAWGVSHSAASELAFIAPIYKGTETFSERILALAGAVEKSGLPTKDLLETVRVLALMPGLISELIERAKVVFNECVRQGMDESSTTLLTILPLMRLINEENPKEYLVDALLVAKEKIEEKYSVFKVTPTIAQMLAARLVDDDDREARFKRFNTVVEFLLTASFPADRATLAVAVQLSKSVTPPEILIPQTISRMNKVFDRWGRNPQLIGIAFDLAMTPGVIQSNVMIVEDLCERIRLIGIEKGRLPKAISLFRNLQGSFYDLSKEASELLFENGMDKAVDRTVPEHGSPNEALLLLAPSLFFEMLKSSTEELSYRRGRIESSSDNPNPSSFSESSGVIDSPIPFYSIGTEAPFSGSDSAGITSSNFISDGITSSGFESGSFSSIGGYDSGFSSSSFGDGGAGSPFDGGGMSSGSSCGSSSSSCGSSSGSSSCGGGGGSGCGGGGG
jgi:hypothetical protein